MTSLEARTLTPEEVAAFGREPLLFNWGVIYNGEPVACFQAEAERGGVLNVHATVRRGLHPQVTRAYARRFSEELLCRGAASLICRIPRTNRAAIRMATAAGYVKEGADGEDEVLR
ncbi:MAG TPA: hypothetical protein VD948_12725, partial [Rhodothermales bacterium]|nr:hypothetical protein [Rhodothermales bacterium]